MGLKRMLSGKWFIRLVLISWIICAVSIYLIFKNMELIVHGQLYYYGLVFSPDWADAYRIFTWLLFLCLGLPMALSGLALVSSFLKVEEVPERENIVPQRIGPPRGVVKVGTPQIVKEIPKRVENGISSVNNGGISCPNCKRVFGRALVMLDFRGGKNRMVSVCPYCNTFLGYTGEEKAANESFHVATPDEKIIR
ncbi:MAG: hypothetical protein Q6362_004695 [Candidatus Wukongarchaeota archaeon]|nr:hypothetical protein [Candidatus Wukongarchaeota archaeon]